MIGFARSNVFQLVRSTSWVWMLGVVLCGATSLQAQPSKPKTIAPPNDLMFQYPRAQARAQLVETSVLVRAATVRSTYSVNGAGLTVAVLDTGARTTHNDFAAPGKIPAQQNYTADNGGNVNDATDGHGHGTNVGGIICANGIHTGIAPGAKMIPIKVLSDSGSGSFASVESGLQWVIDNRVLHNITCVCMSLGDGGNYSTDSIDTLRDKIATLRAARVAVCIAAGNSFFNHSSVQGMGYPGIVRECVSVGATYDASVGGFSYGSGAQAFTSGPKRITPFSQRLHSTTNVNTRTDTFAPGAPLTSAGILNDTAESTMHGTSQATPVVAGLILLAQQHHFNLTGQYPTIDKLEAWLRRSNSQIFDGDDEDDNVANTNKYYFFADAVELFLGLVNDVTPPPPPGPALATATYISATRELTITGDSLRADQFSVTLSRGVLKITAGNKNCRINGGTSATFNISSPDSPISLVCDTGGGADSVSFTNLLLSTALIQLGDGNDTLSFNYCKVFPLPNPLPNTYSFTLDGGAGSLDAFFSPGSKFLGGKDVKNVP